MMPLAQSGGLKIGNGVSFNRNCIIISRDNIKIGDNVIFGPGVTVYDHDHVFTHDGIKNEFRTGTIVIENDCWIGANVVILRDTHIGKGCMIGAGAVVKGDIPDHSLVKSDRSLQVIPIEKR